MSSLTKRNKIRQSLLALSLALSVMLLYTIIVFALSVGHYPTTNLGYFDGTHARAYTVAPNMRQASTSLSIARSIISNIDQADVYVNFDYDTTGKSVYLVYTIDGTTPTKNNGISVSAVFSKFNNPDRTWYSTIPLAAAGIEVRYVFYISNDTLANAYGRVAGESGTDNQYQTTWTEGNNYFSYIVTSCLATHDSGTTVFTNVQSAIDVALAGGTIKVAGYCSGVQTRSGTTQLALITQSLTIQGGYTTTNWSAANFPTNNTTLDALGAGRVISANVTGGNVNLENLSVTNGTTTLNGGGISALGTATLGISNSVIYSNTATNAVNNGSAGAGLSVSSTVTITNSEFMTNTTGFRGGAVYADGVASIISVTFKNNKATFSRGGGAYFVGTTSVTGTTFINNTANSSGGGARFEGIASVTNTTFINNTSMSSSGAGAGAYFNLAASVMSTTFQSNTATGNTPSGGGGAYFNNSANVISTTFQSNIASSGTGLGGGGAVFLSNANVTATTFINNQTATNGGGAYFTGSSAKKLVNVLFSRNSATTNGAAIYVNNANPLQIIHTTIATPSIGGTQAAVHVVAGTVYITNTIVASHSTGIQQVTAGTVNGSNNLLFDNTTATAGSVTLTNPTTGDPAFFSPATDVYTLTSTSAAIDVGTNASITTDFQGETRPYNAGTPDIGYDESPFTLAIPDLAISKSASPTMTMPSGLVTFTLRFTNNSATVAASNVTITDIIPISLTNLSVMSSGASLVQTGGVTYQWTLPTLAANSNGMITVTGQVSSSLVTNTLLTNVASITSTSGDLTASDNVATATITVGQCFAMAENINIVRASIDASALRTAVAEASVGGTVRVAGYCAGVDVPTTGKVVGIGGNLTIRGYYTMTDNLATAQPGVYTATLDALGNGRVVNITAGTVGIEGFIITNGFGSGGAGAGDGGGIRYNNAGTNLAITNTVIIGNNSSGRGGAIFAQNGSAMSLFITGSQILSNTASSSGGGIGADLNATVRIDSSYLYNNKVSSGDGGAIRILLPLYLTNTDIISNNASTTGGGVNSTSGAVVSISGGSFQSNKSGSGNGGAVIVSGPLYVTSTNFISNSSTSTDGGAISIASSTASLNGGLFQANQATGNGGAFNALANSIVTISGTQFISNTSLSAVSGGGAVRSLNGTINITNTKLFSNSAAGAGGAILTSGSLNMNNNQFLTNTSSSNFGGAVYGSAAITSTNDTFQKNQASKGGAVYAAGSFLVTNSNFYSNSATTEGGGLFIAVGSSTFNSGLIAYNTAITGAGMVVSGSLTMSGGQIYNNSATNVGGGVYISGTTSAFTQTGTVTYSYNSAANLGAAIYVNNGATNLNGARILTNTVTTNGGAIYQANGGITVTNSCIVGNKDTAVHRAGGTNPLSATANWWGAPSGPYSAGGGDSVSTLVDYTGFLGTAIAGCPQMPPVDLAIVKTASVATAKAGDVFSYTIAFSNTTGVARIVVITDIVPVPTITVQSVVSSGAQITATGGTSYTWQVEDLLANEIGYITITAQVSPTAVNGTVFTNTAVITSGMDESGGTANNSSSAVITVAQAVLTVTKTVTPSLNTTYHGAVTYTVVLSNNGATDATGALFTDTLPLSTTFGTWVTQPTGAISSSSQVTWTGQVTANSMITLSFSVSHTQNFGDVITNTAQVNYSGSISNATATFTVTRQPVVTTETYYINEDDIITIIAPDGVLTTAYATDPDLDNLTASLVVSPTQGAFSLNANGTFIYTPANNFSGSDIFTYTVSDGHGGVATGTVTLIVNPMNDAPMVGNSKVLYDGALGVTPTLQTQFIFSTTGATESFGSGGTTVNSTGSTSYYGGWVHGAPFHTSPVLDSSKGFTLRFAAQVISQNFDPAADKNGDGVYDRAPFSVIVLDDNAKGIELGFWTDRIWAQEDGPAEPPTSTLFIQSEGAAVNTTGMVTYELTISGSAYSLISGTTQVLSGSVRDYSAGGAPYTATNFIFLGDDTQSASGQFKLNYVSVITNAIPPTRTVASYTTLPMSDLGVMDLDGGGGSETLTMTVNSGVLTVTSGVSGITLSGNGTNTVVVTGTVASLNNLLAYSATFVTYRSNLGFYGMDTLTMLLNDKGNTGDVVSMLSDSKSFNILVTSPAFSITKLVNNLTPQPGERITYTVIVTNYGNISATNARISDTLPMGLNFAGPITMNPTQGGATLANIVGDLPSLATGVIITANESITITFPVTVTVTASDGMVITNTASVTSAQVSTPVSNSVTITVTGIPVLTMTKVVSGVTNLSNATYHGALTYTVIVTNSGTANATGVLFTDTIPANTVFKSWLIQPSNTFSSGGVITRNGIVTAGQAITFSFVVSHTGNYADVVANTALINYNSVVSSSVATFTVEIAPANCYAEYTGDNTTDFSSPDAQAVRDAINAVSAGGTVKIAGYCAGVAGTEVATITKAITVTGGYTNGTWLTYNSSYTPTLDALGGGRVITASAPVMLQNILVQNGVASGDGGGILTTGAITLTDVKVYSNSTTGQGGGFYASGAAIFLGGTFQNNQSGSFGAGFWANSTLMLSGTQVLSNTVNGVAAAGGGVAFGQATLIGGLFQGNLSNGGTGGLYANNGVTLTGTQFIKNTALAGGAGGLYLPNTGNSWVVNALFVGNQSRDAGSAMQISTSGIVEIIHATIVSSTLPITPAIGISSTGTVYITNSIVTSYAVAIERINGTVVEDYNLFYGNTTNLSGTVTSGGNSIIGNPLFASPATNNYRLSINSAAVDMGLDLGITSDFEGTARPTNGFPDMGYDESLYMAGTDLRVTKSVTPTLTTVSQRITYTVAFSNAASNYHARTVLLTDIIPVSLTNLSVITQVSNNVTMTQTSGYSYAWQLTNFGPGASGMITVSGDISANLVAPTRFTNTATITTSTTDTQPVNNTASVGVDVTTVVLTITKQSAYTGTLQPYQMLTYTLRVTNSGGITGNNVIISDTLPANVTLVITQGGNSRGFAGGIITWAVNSLAVNGNAILTYAVTVNNVVSGTIITNTAQVTSSEVVTPSVITRTDVVYAYIDLSVSKSASPLTPAVGDVVTYTVLITNSGASTATNVIITDTLPSGLNLASYTSSQGSYTMPTWLVGTITPSTRVTLTMVATVTGSSSMTNAVEVQSVDQTDNDSTPNNGLEDDYAKVTITPTYAVLAITKSVTPTTNVPYHGQVTYTIVISNMSAVNAVNTTLSDTLPLSTTFSSWITQSGATDTPSLISWNGQVTASQRLTFSFVADHIGANYGEVVTNTSVVTYASFVTTSNTATFSVAHIITLTLDKRSAYTSSPAPLQPNHAITYTVVVTNSGSGAASNVTISDTLPANTTLVGGSALATSGIVTFSSSPFKWTIPSLAANSAQTLTFRVTVNSGVLTGTDIINMASVTSTEITSPISDTVTDTVRYPVSDLQISKAIVGSSTVLAGNQITYTLTITNAGPDAVSAARVTDTFTGTGTTIASSVISSTGTSCTHSSPNVICNLTSVTGTNVITIVLNTSAAYSGTLTNTAMISFASGIIASDNNNADNQTGNITATVRYRQTDLTISKSRVGTGYVSAGQPVTYTLTVTNNGPDMVNAVVTDTFTGTATLSSITSTVASSCNTGTRSCNLSNLTIGVPQLVTVVLTTGSFSGTLTNSATISATGSFIIIETDASNNSSAEITAAVQLPVADIQVSKTQLNAGEIIAGNAVTYSLMITNNGPDQVNVTLTDTFTGSYASVTYSAAGCSGFALPFSCSLLNMGLETRLITVVLTTTTSFSGTLTNTAFITFTGGVTAVDSVTTNNVSSVTTSVRYPTADLQVSKARVGSGSVLPGGQITYTITITNLGPDTASVKVTDTFTGTLSGTIITQTTGGGTCPTDITSPNVCDFANLTNTETITFVMTTATGFSGIFSNSAQIGLAVANGTDPNLVDNVSEVITALVAGTDLQVTKLVNGLPSTTVFGNQTVNYTVQVRNAGPDDAMGVVVNDALPVGVTFVSSSTVAGSYDNGIGDWTIGNIAKNSTVSLQITVQADAVVTPTVVTNVASLTTFAPTDINAANDVGTATLTIQRPTVSFQSTTFSVGETGGSILIVATLNATSTGTVTVDYNITGGTATNGVDYGATNGIFTFPSGTTVQTFTVVITDDVIFEASETVILSLLNVSSNATIGAIPNTTLTILDNETPPNAAPTARGNLYTISQSSVLTITAPGILANDTDPENNPLTTVLGSTTTNGILTLSSNGSFIYTPTLGFVGSDYFVYLANDGTSNSNPATVTITVQAITPPTAVDDSYTTLPNIPLNVTAGAGVLANDSDPYSLSFTATLVSGPSNGQLAFNSNGSFVYTPTLNFTGNDSYIYRIITTKGSVATATVTIGVNAIPTVSFMAANYTVGEAAGSALISVNLSQAYPLTVTVNYQTAAGSATAGADYTAVTEQLTFTPNVTMQSFSVPITDDTLDENDETVSLLLSGAVNAVITSTNPAMLTITDNDVPPTVNFTSPTFNVNEGSGTVTIIVNLNNPSGIVITVPYTIGNGTATAGSDFIGGSGVMTFTLGMTQTTIVIPIISDALVEGNETFQVALTGATNATLGGTSNTTVTITDNTALPTVQFAAASQTVNENGSSATIPVLLSAVSGTTITVNYATGNNTAFAGSDYQAMSGTLTFTPGTFMLNFNVPIMDDTLMEGDELVNLTLTNPANATLGAPSAASLTIADNDVITPITGLVAFNDSPTTLGQPTTLSATVTAGSGISYTWSLGDGTTGIGNIVLHSYPAGVYTAVVTASNNLGQLTATTVITILEPITGLVVVSDAPTQLGQATQFSATVTAGNFISYTFNFGDGTPPVTLPANWTDGNLTGVLLGHTFATSGTYTVIITASNGVSTVTTTITVTVVGSTPNAVVDLAVAKMVVSPDVLGQPMTYTIVVTNLGPDMATNVTLSDTLPTAVILGTLPNTCQRTATLICNVGTLANGASTTVTMQVTPTQIGLITNVVQVAAAQRDVIMNNNIATATTTIGHALAVIKPTTGGSLTYINILSQFIQIEISNVNNLLQPVVLLLTEQNGVTNVPADYVFADYIFNLAFYQNGQLLPNYVMTTPVTITLNNTVINATDLVLMYNNNGQWVDAATICSPASRYIIDPINHTMQITVCQIPGDFALFKAKPRPFIYLPIILQNQPVSATATPTATSTSPTATPTVGNPQADLIGSFSVSPAKTNFTSGEAVVITVVITNQGTAAAGAFWADFFINPTTSPQNGSFVWNEQCSLSPCYGLAWQVLGLNPGQSVTLTSNVASYSTQHTKWSGLFATGTSDLYLYVDSWSANRSPNGAVAENNEGNNRAEMHGLVVTGPRGATHAPFSLELPARNLPR